jgi:hypothetical protein
LYVVKQRGKKSRQSNEYLDKRYRNIDAEIDVMRTVESKNKEKWQKI